MSRPDEDPVLTSTRREALVALAIWAVATTWSVGYCALYGYSRAPESLTFVLWFPDWVFWGIVVPWAVCIVLSTVFAFSVMGDESLGEEIDVAQGDRPPARGDDEVQRA